MAGAVSRQFKPPVIHGIASRIVLVLSEVDPAPFSEMAKLFARCNKATKLGFTGYTQGVLYRFEAREDPEKFITSMTPAERELRVTNYMVLRYVPPTERIAFIDDEDRLCFLYGDTFEAQSTPLWENRPPAIEVRFTGTLGGRTSKNTERQALEAPIMANDCLRHIMQTSEGPQNEKKKKYQDAIDAVDSEIASRRTALYEEYLKRDAELENQGKEKKAKINSELKLTEEYRSYMLAVCTAAQRYLDSDKGSIHIRIAETEKSGRLLHSEAAQVEEKPKAERDSVQHRGTPPELTPKPKPPPESTRAGRPKSPGRKKKSPKGYTERRSSAESESSQPVVPAAAMQPPPQTVPKEEDIYDEEEIPGPLRISEKPLPGIRHAQKDDDDITEWHSPPSFPSPVTVKAPATPISSTPTPKLKLKRSATSKE
jgi:hypothetical protein